MTQHVPAELTISKDQLRHRRHIVHNVLPPNVDARPPLAQWEAACARIVAWAERKARR